MADKIVAEYTVKVDKAIKDLEKLANKVDKVDDERKKTQDGFKSMSSQISGGFKQLGGVIAGAFATQQLVSFGKEAVKVAAQAEGIQRAFERLNRPNLLNELRKATRGTVDDLTLMRQAVRAENFKVPLENLGKFFDFATQRSIQTGESVDYLVNSIIDGIGRKSTLVLDNLGISASELQEEMKKVGDFGEAAGNIIARELEKSGDVADTTAVKLAKINAALDNMKVVAGEALINLGTGLLYLLGQVDTGIESTDGLAKAAENLASIYNDDVSGAVDKMIQKNQELLANQIKIAELEETRSYQNSREAINNINEQIDKLEERNIFLKEYVTQLKAIYDASIKENDVQKEVIKNLAYYNDLIKELRAEQADSNTTRERVRELEDEINEAVRQRNLLLGKLSKEQKEQIELEEKLRKIRSIVWENMKTDGVPTVVSMSSTLDGLNKLLNEQKDILNKSPEFSKPYKDAKKAIEELEEKIEGFNDDYIDPSKGFPDYAPEGSMSATGQGLIGGEDDDEGGSKPPISDELAKELNQAFQMWSDFYSSINELQSLQNELALQDLKQRFQAEEITRQEYEEKRRAILRKQARQEKANALIQATVNTALAVTAALNTQPFLPLGPIAAGIAAASGAIQIGMIAAQPTPQFEEGGFVDSKGYISGRSHKTGGVLIEAEGGEYITSKKYAQRNKDILEAINSGNWERYKFENIISPAIEQVLEGGMDNIGASIVLQNKFNDKNLLKAIDRHRTSDKNGFEFLANELKKLKQPNRGGYSA